MARLAATGVKKRHGFRRDTLEGVREWGAGGEATPVTIPVALLGTAPLLRTGAIPGLVARSGEAHPNGERTRVEVESSANRVADACVCCHRLPMK